MITRKEYMSNSSELFHAYYLQFKTSHTEQFILDNIGMDKLRGSKCEHLNDVCKISRNGAGTWIWDSTPVNYELLKEAGENNSQSTHTCVGKAVARELLKT